MGAFEEMKAKNHFERLGLPRSSDINAVKMAWLKAARQYHPDAFSADMSPEALKLRSAIFGLVAEANSVLSDPARRAAYIAGLDQGGTAKQDPRHAPKSEAAALEALKKGKIQASARHYLEAVKLFTEATTLDPRLAEALAWRGYARYLATTPHNAADALKDINASIALNASVATAHYFLGYILKRQGETAKALAHFKKCVSLDPRHIDAMREVRMAK